MSSLWPGKTGGIVGLLSIPTYTTAPLESERSANARSTRLQIIVVGVIQKADKEGSSQKECSEGGESSVIKESYGEKVDKSREGDVEGQCQEGTGQKGSDEEGVSQKSARRYEDDEKDSREEVCGNNP